MVVVVGGGRLAAKLIQIAQISMILILDLAGGRKESESGLRMPEKGKKKRQQLQTILRLPTFWLLFLILFLIIGRNPPMLMPDSWS